MIIQKQKQADVSVHRVHDLMTLLCWAVVLALLSGCESYRTDKLIRNPEALEPLLTALRDPDPNVQWWAAWALGEIGSPAEEALKKLLRDPDRGVQRWAKEALNKIQNIPFDQTPR
jgi:hypothetical protein